MAGIRKDEHESRRRGVGGRRANRMLASFVGVALAGLLLEIILRFTGARPFEAPAPGPRVTPDQPVLRAMPDGPYRFTPGRVSVEVVPEFGWHMTHGRDGLRITSEAPVVADEELWLMGCSLTHGWSVNDEESYPWRVQSVLTNVAVVNGGVSGYGTIHSRLLFQQLLDERGQPEIVIYAYGRFHDYRNTFARVWSKGFSPANQELPFRVPRARFGRDGEIVYDEVDVVYREWPFQRWSALVNTLEKRFNGWEAGRSRSDEVTRELIANWAVFCLREKIRFIVAGISSDAGPMLDWCRETGIESVDIAVPLSGTEFTNLPYDNHPNARAHREYADSLIRYLRPER